ncbi:hypothetical protein DQ04_23321000 [Trypanosoma grayi]|uniref:hypothetical protein n=1 Tax=Trypanosoma grayi TaxID=71804 RepID=UPI0004F49BEE|nr:hypothetical protein DQ04_23321000 [Trypanosoma grayi]KEG05338.1 hypothetical protein DQ04_23321000 [Trypanosoma grayi]
MCREARWFPKELFVREPHSVISESTSVENHAHTTPITPHRHTELRWRCFSSCNTTKNTVLSSSVVRIAQTHPRKTQRCGRIPRCLHRPIVMVGSVHRAP